MKNIIKIIYHNIQTENQGVKVTISVALAELAFYK